ncbi:peptidoglycan DD-metalloendopeptidase family protein [Streptomyces sp. 110]|uniref:Peptidoglycan DD-metalloendopeptidase family protein n=1 Tax=Streptomyces endocoffeicus TaxID=2898945 RepID=A0ABS1PVK7_9ACTN|nr:M23 family metallopeptidase [Streptomyces endocoffeicus]MBL1116005.1 peptidoglycan DD-metalloendopeptidase family protein [Streptomyces endocoffeicus]
MTDAAYRSNSVVAVGAPAAETEEKPVVNERQPSGDWVPAGTQSPDAAYGIYHAYYHDGAQHGGVRSSGYDDEDPLFGAMPSVYDTTAALYDEPDHRLSCNAYGYDPTTMWDTPGHAEMSSSAADLGPADPSGYIAQWEDSTGQGRVGVDSTACFEDSESRDATADAGIASPGPSRADVRNRRASARRSALLTVAVPSAVVMAITGAAAVSVSVDDQDEKATQAAPDATQVIEPSAANGKLDAQLAGVTRGADDFADRASRTQQRIDLKQRQLQERRRKAAEAAHRKAEAARKEALRPKFALPVAQRGVGELFGAAGSMWSSRHTGLDFPVPMNTPVMAVTDGTVEAKWNPFYGNMVIVTAPDGTETWYCHLASAKIRAGHVKAGETIAYAGSSGNSSGPHLHLEVHPGGGDAIDPLAWLRGHGLDPT